MTPAQNKAKQAYRHKLHDQGLCMACKAPTGGRWCCDDCTRKNTLYQRAKRRAKQYKTKCSLCLTRGHNYTSCDLNPDRKHA